MLIDCDTCAARNIACGDCVVNVLLGDRPGNIELDSAEESALGAFASGGLLPPLRLVPTYRAEPVTPDDPGAHRPTGRRADAIPVRSEKSDGGRSAIA